MLVKKEKDIFYDIVVCLKKIPNSFKVSAISTLIFGLISHMFMYTNTLFTHDASAYYADFPVEGIMKGGRWLGGLGSELFGGLSLPWLTGILILFTMSIASWLVCKVLDIDRTFLIVLVSGLMITSPHTIAFHSYVSSAYCYSTSILLAVLAVYLLEKNTIKSFLISIISFYLSVSLYPSYIFFGACLVVIMAIKKAVINNASDAWKLLLKFALMTVLSLLLYYVFSKLLILIWNDVTESSNDFRGEYVMRKYYIASLVKWVVEAYKYTLHILLKPSFRSYYPIKVLIPLWIGLITSGIQILVLLIKKRANLFRWATTFFLVLLLPLAVSSIVIFCNYIPTCLMTFTFVILWIFIVQTYDYFTKNIDFNKHKKLNSFKRICAIIVLCVSLFTCVFYAYVANVAYLKLKNNYDSGLSFVTNIVYKIQNTPGYTDDTKVAIIGMPKGNTFGYEKNRGFSVVDHVSGINRKLFTYEYALYTFINQEISIDMELISSDDVQITGSELDSLGVYPAENCSMWTYHGVLVIKVGDQNTY